MLTGSPKPLFQTKEEFVNYFTNGRIVICKSLADKSCRYLITNSYDSSTNKMKIAEKKGIEIITYQEFKERFEPHKN